MTDVDWELVFRYFGDECSPEERERFERWLAADPQRRIIVDAAVVAAGRTLQGKRPAPLPPPRRLAAIRPSVRPAWLVPLAASIAIAIGGTVLTRHPAWRRAADATARPSIRVAQTVRGERQELRLADGTRIVLGPASTLRYPTDVGTGPREVELTGEAFFEVTHDAAHPFRVRAGHAQAEDIGTAFGVRAYPEDSVVRVTVKDGSVSLGPAGLGPKTRAVLTPGQLGALATGMTAPVVSRVNVDASLAWMSGRLAFDDSPLSEVLAQLGRWYDVPFRLADKSLATRTLTASFSTESLPDVLSALAPVLDVRFERVADTLVVRAVRH